MIARGALSHLEELQVEKSSSLGINTLHALIGGCKELRSVGDLSQWEGISGPELGEMRQMAHEQNLQLDLSSHQVLRRFLGLAGGDQRAMMTLMTGPIMERIRLTQVSSYFILHGEIASAYFHNLSNLFFRLQPDTRVQLLRKFDSFLNPNDMSYI